MPKQLTLTRGIQNKVWPESKMFSQVTSTSTMWNNTLKILKLSGDRSMPNLKLNTLDIQYLKRYFEDRIKAKIGNITIQAFAKVFVSYSLKFSGQKYKYMLTPCLRINGSECTCYLLRYHRHVTDACKQEL